MGKLEHLKELMLADNYKENLGVLIRTIYDFAFVTYADLPRGAIKNNSMRRLAATTLMEILPPDIAERVNKKMEEDPSSSHEPIKVYGVEGRYAHALFSAASRTGALDSAEAELAQVKELLEDAEVAEYCFDPTINKLEKRDVITTVLASKGFSDLTVNFVSVIAEENRLKRTKGIIGAFDKIMKARRGEVDCTVVTAKPLDFEMEANLVATLQKFVKPTETLKIETSTDSSLIGGMVINLGEYFIDMSTATKIKRITKALKGEN